MEIRKKICDGCGKELGEKHISISFHQNHIQPYRKNEYYCSKDCIGVKRKQ